MMAPAITPMVMGKGALPPNSELRARSACGTWRLSGCNQCRHTSVRSSTPTASATPTVANTPATTPSGLPGSLAKSCPSRKVDAVTLMQKQAMYATLRIVRFVRI